LLYDTLASQEDLELLFERLLKFKDINGKHPVITANTVVANPYFQKIKEHNFEQYYYEPFTETLKKYYPNHDVWATWQKGIEENVFFPQYHGREHVNAPYWLRGLRNKNDAFLKAFEFGCWSCPIDIKTKINLQASYDTEFKEDFEFHTQSILEGLQLFEKLFKYPSRSFIANNFIWSSKLDRITSNSGVQFIQGMKYQKLPLFYNTEKRKMIRHYLGNKNKFGQYYLIRNCVFEPSQRSASFNNVGKCLAEIKNAFMWNKPAIITSHRLNYIGSLIPENREKNLTLLETLLKKILKKWPDVEFMSSVDLGNLISSNKS